MQIKYFSLFNEAKNTLGPKRTVELFNQVVNPLDNNKAVSSSRNNSSSKTNLEIANSAIEVFPFHRGYFLTKNQKENYFFGAQSTIPLEVLKKSKKMVGITQVITGFGKSAVFITKSDHFIYSNSYWKSKLEKLQYPGNQIAQTYLQSSNSFDYSLFFIFKNGKVQFFTNKTAKNKLLLQEFEKYNFDFIHAVYYDDTYLIRKDGSIIKLDFKNKKITEYNLSILEANEKIVNIKAIDHSDIVIETDKNKLIYISADKLSTLPKMGNTQLVVQIIDNFKSYATNHFCLLYQTDQNEIKIISSGLNLEYQNFITTHFSKQTQGISLNNRFIFGKTGSNSYVISKIIGSNNNEIINLNNILHLYFNDLNFLVQKIDGTFHYLDENNQLVPINIDFNVSNVIPVAERGFVLKSKENDFMFIEDFIPYDSSSPRIYKIDIQKKDEKIVKYYPSSENLLIQFENGTFQSLLQYDYGQIKDLFPENTQNDFYLEDLSKINFHIEDLIHQRK